jgi:hypothetical protein
MHHPSQFDGHDSEMLDEIDRIPNFANFGASGHKKTHEAPIRDLKVGVAGLDQREATDLAQAARAKSAMPAHIRLWA